MGDRGTFNGGSYYQTSSYWDSNVIQYVTISSPGNATDFGNLTLARIYPAALSSGVDERGVIGGGDGSGESDIMDYFTVNTTGNAADFGDLLVAKKGATGTSNGVKQRGRRYY